MKEEVIMKLKALPEAISKVQLRVIEASKAKSAIEYEMKIREAKLYNGIVAQINAETGKPVYTNDTARKSALQAAMGNDAEYKKLQTQAEEAHFEWKKAEIDAEKLQRDHQSYKAIARLMSSE
jgi:hypothetical protein